MSQATDPKDKYGAAHFPGNQATWRRIRVARSGA
jgi:hypothetical protein